ncbi:prepilin peptidase [Glaciihabitans sp. INWT7]|uniref:prepilin peptidase n=1 Tax=Glaciihabitans sp. INWT7 TaxID=2596912 RepID=UPI001624C24B|nr:A24 family peptidase [Glaciihabitans sp. INWT7]QNE47969.1 prepilin peptidase [Glaciihabitans sp. INWT7]
MIAVTVVLAAVLGLLLGSFLNVVVYRVPIGKSIVSPPSACPNCEHEIKPYDNIPVLSWLLLRGKCRNCAAPISARYPLVELATSLSFALVALGFAPAAFAATTSAGAVAAVLVMVAFLYLAAITIALALIDLDVHKLPNVIVIPAYAVGAALFGAASFLSGDFGPLIGSGIAMAGLFLFYLVMALVYPGGMGLGDVKLAGVLGIYLGWAGWGAVAVGAFSAFLLAGVFSIILLATKRAGRKSGIPFGPWMFAGAWLGIVVGNAVFASYLSVFDLTVA